jgi:hypothetical protein
MTLTDIISKVTRYAKKVIVTDNSSTVAASIAQAGTGDGLSITTTTGTTLKLQQNNTNPVLGGTLDFFPPTGGEITFDGGSDGKFSFTNTSTVATKATVFSGANVGISEISPETPLHVAGIATLGRVNNINEGGEIMFKRASDNLNAYSIDVFGSGTNPQLRITDVISTATRIQIESNGNVNISDNLGIGIAPTRRLDVFGTVRFQSLPTFADNAAAIAGGLSVGDVYKTTIGQILIVV